MKLYPTTCIKIEYNFCYRFFTEVTEVFLAPWNNWKWMLPTYFENEQILQKISLCNLLYDPLSNLFVTLIFRFWYHAFNNINYIVLMNFMFLYNTVSIIYAMRNLHFVEFSFCSHMFSLYKFEYIYCWYQCFEIFQYFCN